MARVKEPRPLLATDSSWFRLLQKAPPRERLMALLAGEAGMRRAGVAVARCDDLIETIGGYSVIVHGKGSTQRVAPPTDRLTHEILTCHQIATTATATCFRAWTGAAMCSAPTSPTTTSASC